MNRGLLLKGATIVAATLIALIYLSPTLIPEDSQPGWMKKVLTKKIQPGLDLQGGLHLVYSVNVEKAVSDKADKLASEIEDRIKRDLKLEATVTREGVSDVVVKTKNPADVARLDNAFMAPNRAQLTEPSRDTATGTFRASIDENYVADIRDNAVRQAIETIRGRVDKFGVVEPTIISKGDDIVIELPGLKPQDFERIKGIIGRTAQLEFKIAADESDYIRRISELVPKESGIEADQTSWTGKNTGTPHSMYYLRGPSRDALEKFFASLPPDKQPPPELEVGYEEVQSRDEGAAAGKTTWWAYMLRRRAVITGEYLANTDWTWDQQTGQPEVLFSWDREGTNIFEKASGDNIDRKLAIILDGKVNSAPVIESKIGRDGRITLGGYGDPMARQNEAKDLVAVLRTGALPAPLTKTFETQVGPTLGRDAIESAKLAIGAGAIAVTGMMVFYYKLAGIISIIAMTLNLLYMLAILAGFEAAMTLPGIAGLGLTIGMAVDSNIIFYERIREELRAGKSPRSAVDAGFGHAFWAVFDAHVTNLVAGIVLYSYGSGPIRGFAVTLMVGIVANLFTSVWVSRAFFDFIVNRKRTVQTLSI